ncbi:YceI family protein [Amycolatopsis saalfeldensis]|nr:YceI family protein [Amycolatopsis saalfeldensis]
MTVTETLQLPAPGAYRLDPDRTAVTFSTRHLFGLAPVRGFFRLRSGHVDVADPLPSSAVRAVIEASSVDTRNPVRDTAVRSKQYLDAEHHPEFVFASTGIEPAGEGWSVAGVLTIRGHREPVTLAVTACAPSAGGFLAVATARVDRYAFGVTTMRGMAARYLNLRLEIRAVAVR